MEFGRLIVAMVTPFRNDLEIDCSKAGELASRLVQQGVESLVLSGTTGESPTLSRKERIDLIKAVRNTVKVPLIANAGTNDTRISIQNAKDAEEAGADGILLVAPYYNKPDQEMMYDHFSAIANSVRIPVMLYNVPGRTAVSIKPETIIRLSRDVKNITMLKDAAGNLDDMTAVIRNAANGFRVYTGEDSLTLPSLSIGGYGVVSVTAHVAAGRMREMINAYLAGDMQRAAEVHSMLYPLNKALFLQPNPVPVKKALKMLGFDAGPLRPPLKEASDEVTKALEAGMRVAGVL